MPDDQAPDIQGTMQDVLSAQTAIQQNAGSQGGPNPGVPLQPPSNRPGLPAIAQLMSQLIKPTAQGPTNQNPANLAQGPSRPSRLDAFEHFLGNFITSFAAGMGQSGSGPGANARGFGAAVNAPLEQARQQFALQQQAQQVQSQTQYTQAHAELERAQAGMVPVVQNGQTIYLPAKDAVSYLNAQTKAASATDVANIRSGATVQSAQIGAASKEKVAAMSDQVRKDIAAGQLGVAQARVKYMGMDTQSKAAYRTSVVNNLQYLAIQKAQATASAATKNTAQAQAAVAKANNTFSAMANLARAIGISDDEVGVPLEVTEPIQPPIGNQPAAAPASNIPTGGGIPTFGQWKAGRK